VVPFGGVAFPVRSLLRLSCLSLFLHLHLHLHLQGGTPCLQFIQPALSGLVSFRTLVYQAAGVNILLTATASRGPYHYLVARILLATNPFSLTFRYPFPVQTLIYLRLNLNLPWLVVTPCINHLCHSWSIVRHSHGQRRLTRHHFQRTLLAILYPKSASRPRPSMALWTASKRSIRGWTTRMARIG
jgi:hypothetical protein